ncbi:MAG: hypothetical protein AAGA37_21315 [Actinomycetota bacterium]
MTATTSSTVARSVVRPALLVAAVVLGALAYFWFQPDAGDEARLALLEADVIHALPTLDGETPELLGTETNVASRDWTGSWSLTERADRYALQDPNVDRYLADLYAHLQDSTWEFTSVRCGEAQFVLTGRQVIDGDWATLEFTAWPSGETARLSVRTAISAVGGNALVVEASEEPTDAAIDCLRFVGN